jgi:molybdopterin-biosynthesis enzyme MoeA-like protein
MAGVPMITQGMLAALDGQLEGGAPVLSRTVAAWTQESKAAEVLRRTEKDNPGVQIGSYPFWREGRTGANFVIRSTDPAQLADVAQKLMAGLAEAGISPVDGEL